jgi:hypothetical protein
MGWVERSLIGFLCLSLLALAWVVGMIVWDALTPHETLVLRADRWSCTQEQTDYMPVVTMVGKVAVTNMMPVTECVTYRRKS